MKFPARDAARYLLYALVLVTANENRKSTGLITSWIFHAIGHTPLLLMPEIYSSLATLFHIPQRAQANPTGMWATVNGVMDDLVVDNPHYVEYMAPAAIAYILAFPGHNMYKSEWANEQLFGFGLDSIPHAMTAFALVRFTYDALRALGRHLPPSSPVAAQAQWAEQHAGIIAAGTLAAATAFYEGGEYLIHRAELKAVHNDPTKIAMEWSLADTVQDIISNTAGGLAAAWINRRRKRAASVLAQTREALA